MTEITVPTKPSIATEEAVPEHTTIETYKNITLEKRAYFDAEAEEIHMILSGIGDDIYSIVDACTTAKEMWIAIERSYALTRTKGKEIAKPVTPPYESAFDEDNDHGQAQRDKDMNKNVDNSLRNKNDKQTGQFENQRIEYGHFAKECRKPKRAKDYAYHKEKMLLCKQAEKGVPLRVEQGDWIDDTDEETDEQELEAHYMYMAKIHNVIPNSSDMCVNDDQADQNADEYEDERVVLANLIANLKLDHDANKKILKQLKKANTSLTHELNECKSAVVESNDIRDRCKSALHDQEIKLEKYKKYKNCQLEKEKAERKLKDTLGLLTQQKFQSDEALKTQAYETFQFKEKNAELVH
ncbi:hypothetical protein Tco_0929379 [Tanacetum coccineum]